MNILIQERNRETDSGEKNLFTMLPVWWKGAQKQINVKVLCEPLFMSGSDLDRGLDTH